MSRIYEDVEAFEEIKKSRFYTYLHRSVDEEDAREFIKIIKKRHPDATHHCTAMVVGNIQRSSDDGEPAGTAGRPMLDVLVKNGLEDVTAVVVRYFGGTLLGKGGLVRAYSSGVQQALAKASLTSTQEVAVYLFPFTYAQKGRIDAWIKSEHIEVLDEDYDEQVTYTIACAKDYNLMAEAARLTSGQSQVEFLEYDTRESIIS